MTTTPKSQNHLAMLLGISKGVCSTNVRAGMPTHSVEAAQAWRRTNLCPARSKQPPKPAPAPPPPSPALRHAAALMEAAGLVLQAGGSIETLVPALRPALAAVPKHERDHVGLDVAVMNVLVAHVFERAASEEPGHCEDSPMSDDDAQWMGEFWYGVAAGEWRLTGL